MATATAPRTKKPARKPYDPGKPAEVRKIGAGHYTVESFREPGRFYAVNLGPGDHGAGAAPETDDGATCSCPDHTTRGRACKHIAEARLCSYRETLAKAESLPTEHLVRLLVKPHRPEIREALEVALFARGISVGPPAARTAEPPARRWDAFEIGDETPAPEDPRAAEARRLCNTPGAVYYTPTGTKVTVIGFSGDKVAA